MDTETALTQFTALKKKADDLLKLDKITLKDIEPLDNRERKYLSAM